MISPVKSQPISMQMPVNMKKLHFVGIGGIGMSGIAEILLNLGYKISGSDINTSSTVKRLQDLGAEIFIGQEEKNVIGAQAIVISTAIKSDNPEYISAQKNRIPIVHRSEILAEIMRLKLSIAIGGTHGKTTTTSLVAHALTQAGLEPTIVNGGIINSIDTNAKLGEGKWLVAEADESDGSFTRLPATIAVVTNIDEEHLDFYGNFSEIKKAFKTFIENIPFYGSAILCTDHKEVQKLNLQVNNRKIVTFGLNPQADVRADNITSGTNGTTFDVITNEGTIKSVFIPINGTHNIQNTLASIAVALEVGVKIDKIANLYKNFNGVKRRFTKTGLFNGAVVIDDYAHHPVEIKAVLQAARSATNGKIHVIMQPHRYSRIQSLFDDFSTCFNEADNVYISPIYSAGEQPIQNIDNNILAKGIVSSGHHSVSAISSLDEVPSLLTNIDDGDIILFLGAGDISKWANNLPNKE